MNQMNQMWTSEEAVRVGSWWHLSKGGFRVAYRQLELPFFFFFFFFFFLHFLFFNFYSFKVHM